MFRVFVRWQARCTMFSAPDYQEFTEWLQLGCRQQRTQAWCCSLGDQILEEVSFENIRYAEV